MRSPSAKTISRVGPKLLVAVLVVVMALPPAPVRGSGANAAPSPNLYEDHNDKHAGVLPACGKARLCARAGLKTGLSARGVADYEWRSGWVASVIMSALGGRQRW